MSKIREISPLFFIAAELYQKTQLHSSYTQSNFFSVRIDLFFRFVYVLTVNQLHIFDNRNFSGLSNRAPQKTPRMYNIDVYNPHPSSFFFFIKLDISIIYFWFVEKWEKLYLIQSYTMYLEIYHRKNKLTYQAV